MIKISKGSIFDSKCDLIIIPCNNAGGVTQSILKELMANNLPYYKCANAGDVVFVENIKNFSNASVIGFAASVDVFESKSTSKIIKTIMQTIRSYCEEQSLHKINIPLLGTGAGGLDYQIVHKIMKEEFLNISNISLNICVLSDDIYTDLSKDISPQYDNYKNPRVFISYTNTDNNNRKWVKKLACKLRQSGVDARLDMFHLKPGQDLPQWMKNELIMADKVLIICDKYYAEKADNRRGGVGWETMIIQGDMLSKQAENKYIAILRDKDIDHSLPIYVKSRYALDWSDENQIDTEFDNLLYYLFDCDIEPPLGEIPNFIKDKLRQNS
jgi:O-acetyl-ADP-ribose deacetylase (regulator of RNase III)